MQTRAPILIDSAGRPLQLGPQLGSGGEGAVFELRDRSDLVAKLYHKGLEPEKAAKIANMAKAASERLLKLTAWPTEPIRRGSASGAVVGFTMPKTPVTSTHSACTARSCAFKSSQKQVGNS